MPGGRPTHSRIGVWIFGLALALSPSSAGAFALFPDYGLGPPEAVLDQAARWSVATGLADGIQVGIGAGVVDALRVGNDTAQQIETAIVNGFLAWESPVLDFDITLDAPGTVEGADFGFEIDVFAVPGDHPVFLANPSAFTGLALPAVYWFDDRPLSNGAPSSGWGITGGDLYLNIDHFAFLAPLQTGRLDVMTRVVIHEVGHLLGLGHPNQGTNYDTDLDPTNAMQIDPRDPFADVIVSPNFDGETIMSNEPCGPNPGLPCAAVFYTSLRPDELGGRDVLYPVVPEPATGPLLAAGLAGLATLRRRR